MDLNRSKVFVLTLAAGFLLPAAIPNAGLDYPYFFILVIVLFAWFLLKWERVKEITSRSSRTEITIGIAIIGADYVFNAVRASTVGLIDLLIVFLASVILVFGAKSLKLFWVPVAYGLILLLGYQIENSIPNYVALQDWMAGLMATWSQALGIPASASGHLITLNSGANPLVLSVESDCTGIQGVLAFGMLSTMALLDLKPKISRLLPIFIIGFVGVFLLNFVRLFAVVMTFEFLGIEAGTTMHLFVGYALFVIWVLAFWTLAFRYLVPRPSVVIATAESTAGRQDGVPGPPTSSSKGHHGRRKPS